MLAYDLISERYISKIIKYQGNESNESSKDYQAYLDKLGRQYHEIAHLK